MTLKEDILIKLRDSIASGEYEPGEHLREEHLSRRFNVSRTPIREALNQLEKEGFIKIIPEVGAKVAQFSQNDIADIYDLLIVLEGLGSRLAAARITNEQLYRLEELHFAMVKAANQKELRLFFELNTHFHMKLIEASENSYLIDMRMNFRRLIDRFADISHLIPGQWQASIKEHPKILEALKSKEPVLAEFLTKEHVENGKNRLIQYLLKLDNKDKLPVIKNWNLMAAGKDNKLSHMSDMEVG
jgi:DNA-binding GntR family transcriptional regulator